MELLYSLPFHLTPRSFDGCLFKEGFRFTFRPVVRLDPFMKTVCSGWIRDPLEQLIWDLSGKISTHLVTGLSDTKRTLVEQDTSTVRGPTKIRDPLSIYQWLLRVENKSYGFPPHLVLVLSSNGPYPHNYLNTGDLL